LTWLSATKSTSWKGPVPTGSTRIAGASLSSAGMMTIGTEKELRSSMKVGCTFFILMTKVNLSGASHFSTLAKVLRSMPSTA